jgi:amidase
MPHTRPGAPGLGFPRLGGHDLPQKRGTAMNALIENHDATALSEMVARREVSAGELLEAAIAATDASAGTLNAVPIRFDDVARTRAAQALEGPFAGVPFLLKDIGQEYAGQAHTAAAAPHSRRIEPEHSYYTRRCLAAGLVIFGRTATPEFGLRAQTESRLWGPSRNPWDPARSPGGSSGGSAAAVAGGIVPMAGANDGGGSIRIPAAYCGLFGLKPSTGRVSWGPALGFAWEGASANGVLTRSVRDTARMLDVLSGPEPGEFFQPPPPFRPYAEEVGAPPGTLRIGYSTASPLGTPVAQDCIDAVGEAARLLEGLGHHVEAAAPAIDGRAVASAYMTLYLGQVGADVAASGAADSAFELETGLLASLGRALSAAEYVTAHRAWNGFARALGAFHQRYDLWLLPTVAGPPPKIGELRLPKLQQRVLPLLRRLRAGRLLLKAGALETMSRDALSRTPFTQISNMTFTPSMSVPLHMAPAEPGGPALPVGVQFVARFGAEDVLLRLAAQLEAAAPWAGRRPV